MKRKVLCVFSLILFLLIFCTFLSMKIEVEMLTQVEVKTIKASKTYFGNIELPISVLFKDEYQTHLYEVVEGTGWESGMRIQEIASQQYLVSEENQLVTMSPGNDYTFVLTASRQPNYGELVEIVEDIETAPDTYLVYYPNGVPEYESLPAQTALLSQSENTLLLSVEEATFPFFEHRAKNVLTPIGDSGMRVFSLSEAEDFLNQLPLLTMLALLLVVPVMFWAASCIFSCWDRSRAAVLLNAVLIALALCALPQLLERIDLPASLLPGGNILDWKYYEEEFSLLFGALAQFADAGRDLLLLKANMAADSFRIMWVALLITAAVLIAEGVIIRLAAKPFVHKKKYAGKYVKHS